MTRYRKFILLWILGSIAFTSYGQNATELKEIYSDLSLFKDALATELNKNVTAKEISGIKNSEIRTVAEQLLSKSYDTQYRLNSFHSYLSPRTLGMELAIGDGYSKYENITGMFLPKGKHILLVDGIEADKEAELLVPNWFRHPPNEEKPTEDAKGWGIERKTFSLRNGVNIINLDEFGGLAYVGYYSDKPENDKAISIHFLTGEVNGYFDIRKHNDADWDRLSTTGTYPIMDAIGDHIQVVYPKEAIQKYAKGRGVELISNYDSLVYRQHRIMGVLKHNRSIKNRILSRVNYNYYMFRDGDGVAYMGGKQSYAMGMVVNPDEVIKGDPCWGFSHEVGHVHQCRPYFNWGGLGEVSNNIFSLYVTTSFGNPSRIQEQGNYQKARKSLYKKDKSYLQDEDVFNRLVPFWQLHLYFSRIENYEDFYGDLFETFRKQAEEERQNRRGRFQMDRGNRNPAVHQLNFVKKAIEVGGVDLTEFFENYGFFYVGEFEYEDYGKYSYSMTQEMVDEVKAEIKALNLPKPKTDPSTLEDDK